MQDNNSNPKKSEIPARRDLILKKFDQWQPESLFRPEADTERSASTAPEMVQADTPQETACLKNLLLKKFDLNSSPADAPEATEDPQPTGQQERPPFETDSTTGPREKIPQPIDRRSISESSESVGNNSATLYFLVAFGMLIFILVGQSFLNTQKYQIKAIEGGIEISRGIFSPMSYEPMMEIPGVAVPSPAKKEYNQGDVYPIISKYYLGKAASLMEVPGAVEFEKVGPYLDQALTYAITQSKIEAISQKKNQLERTTLTHRADLAVGKGTPLDLKKAAAYLTQAAALQPGATEAELIKIKQGNIQRLLEVLQKQEAATPPPATKTE